METYQLPDFLGKTFNKIEQRGDEIHFYNRDEHYRMYHDQDCCECVYIESIVGSLDDLVGSSILIAEKNVVATSNKGYSSTATFYKFATIKGYVDIRWIGESNGYYSESVYVVLICDKGAR